MGTGLEVEMGVGAEQREPVAGAVGASSIGNPVFVGKGDGAGRGLKSP